MVYDEVIVDYEESSYEESSYEDLASIPEDYEYPPTTQELASPTKRKAPYQPEWVLDTPTQVMKRKKVEAESTDAIYREIEGDEGEQLGYLPKVGYRISKLTPLNKTYEQRAIRIRQRTIPSGSGSKKYDLLNGLSIKITDMIEEHKQKVKLEASRQISRGVLMTFDKLCTAMYDTLLGTQ